MLAVLTKMQICLKRKGALTECFWLARGWSRICKGMLQEFGEIKMMSHLPGRRGARDKQTEIVRTLSVTQANSKYIKTFIDIIITTVTIS